MKFTDIAKVAKRDKVCYIMDDVDGSQWLNTMDAVYRLEGLPKMNSDDFLNLLGVPENKKNKWEIGDMMDEAGLTKTDRPGEMELTADPAGISVFYNSMCMTPFYTPDGVLWMDEDLLEPVRKIDSHYLRFFLRREKGRRMVAVKDGLILVAVISPVKMSDDFMDKINIMWRKCRQERGWEGVYDDEISADDLYHGEGAEDSEPEPADAGHGGED